MGAEELRQAHVQPETDQQITLRIISHVENGAFFDFKGDRDGTLFERYRRVYHQICSTYELGEAREIRWWEWGTRAGFTII